VAQRDFEAALEHLRAYLELRPRDSSAHLLAARAARSAGLFGEAKKHLEECQRVGGVTEALELEWLLLRVQQGDLEETEGILKRSITPDHPDALAVLEALTAGYLKRGRLLDALEALGLWLGKEPESVPALSLRGWVWQRLGRTSQALTDYRRAVELAPDDLGTRLALAQLLTPLKPTEAADHFEAARRRRPEDPVVLVGLARCRVELGRPEEARQLLDQALARDTRHPAALAERGRVALILARVAEAERWLRQAVERAPDDREALYELLRSVQLQHKTTEAEHLGRQLTRLTADLKRIDELIGMIARSPHDPDLRREAGAIALRCGREKEGLKWLDSALRENPGHAPTHRILAELYASKGNLAQAERHRRLADRQGGPGQ
jgi:tetratricopeptide (TPR) repeat protein